jgi:hypothetical protein
MIVDDPNQRQPAPAAVDPERCATDANRTAWLWGLWAAHC